MRIATWNLNGIRAAARNGLREKLDAIGADAWLFQEVRARPDQLEADWSEPKGWTAIWHPAQKPGYAGTALWTRSAVSQVARGAHDEDAEGRVLSAKVGPVRLVSVYLPSGSSGPHRQAEKDLWMPAFSAWSAKLARSRVPTILGGDFNIAHEERDLYYAKANQKQSGFLPHERAWFGGLLEQGWSDLVRERMGPVDGPYTWWSNRGRARELDRGWRIDYLLANRAAGKLVREVWVDRGASLGVSDHAPVVADLDLGV